MHTRRFSNVIGIDDAPFTPKRTNTLNESYDELVTVVGAVYAKLSLHGVLIFKVTQDGDDATDALINAIKESKFLEHIQLIMLQGIAFGGFNVVDVPRLSKSLNKSVLVVSRREPDMAKIKKALLEKVPNGSKKLSLIEALGPMEPAAGLFIQRYGLTRNEAFSTIKNFSINGLIPEPIRVAHLIGGALIRGISSGRV
ncbi:hypothetical protein DBT_0857 [Dissulfuribacter thermophilus]|uniref:Uncharacterized protein n=1 Tax=Dissulfuribacter thermophilus TaxID=1156395 RepID=A0A1B9F7P0_9BACT|nr:DUF99 family protein [Dissulfuribacter thermophilus]OCC15932.1 hypothetical protein DBT_0857 [Dissulfuribacter thermophilus]